jgi:hypothetical protein
MSRLFASSLASFGGSADKQVSERGFDRYQHSTAFSISHVSGLKHNPNERHNEESELSLDQAVLQTELIFVVRLLQLSN